jgi:hypothetical protein
MSQATAWRASAFDDDERGRTDSSSPRAAPGKRDVFTAGAPVEMIAPVNFQRAAELQALLEGIGLPASREQLVAYAAREDGAAAVELERIPPGEYDRLDAVGEALRRTQPRSPESLVLPKPESGLPPGGSDYLNAGPESGAVRSPDGSVTPPHEVIEQQTQTLNRQQQSQQQ